MSLTNSAISRPQLVRYRYWREGRTPRCSPLACAMRRLQRSKLIGNSDSKRHSDFTVRGSDSSAASKRTTVRFAEYCEVVLVPNRGEYSDQEKLDMYLSQQDLDQIRNERYSIMESMARGIFPDDETKYFRGLECQLENCKGDRKRKISKVRDALFEVQAFDETIDPEWIDNCYQKLTYDARALAHNLGRYDAFQSLSINQ
mmetsp:Transcript_15398/g.42695  ORF Transcript_15398/g.42695 Transcript_15398/m.42695 type:complete len:201 (-) Transcript_15398:1170-1772(-)